MNTTRQQYARAPAPWGSLVCATVVALTAADAPAGQRLSDQTLLHNGLTRYYDLYVPDSLSEAPVPLLLVLHGGTGDKSDIPISPYLFLEAFADAEPALLVYPNGTSAATGTTGPSGSFNWNDCRSDAGPGSTDADDVGFLVALVGDLSSTYPIDPDRVFTAGVSNGGLMSYRLVLEASSTFAAAAAGIANRPAQNECAAAPTSPVSVLIMNGTADSVMPWSGGTVLGGRGSVLSAEATRDYWRGVLDADENPTLTAFPDLDPSDDSTVELETYEGGTGGHTLRFYRVINGGHTLPSAEIPTAPILGRQNRDIETAVEVWDFLQSVSVPEPASSVAGWLALAALGWRGRSRRNPQPPWCEW